MNTSSTCAGRRALSRLNALLVVPAFLIGTSTLTAFTSSPAQATPKREAVQDEKTYNLARIYKAKDVSKYKFVVTSSINSPQLGGMVDIVLDMAMRETIKDVKSNGDAVLLSEFDSASVKLGPNAMENDITALLPTVTTTVDKSGKVVDVVIDGGNPQFTSGPGSSMFKSLQQQNFFPGKPVKVGDTWKVEIDAKDKSGIKTVGTATLVGTETIDGIATVKIKVVSDAEVTQDNPETNKPTTVKTHSEAFGNYEIATGRVVKMSSKSNTDSGVVGKTEMQMSLVTDKKTDPKKTDAKKTDAKK